MDSYRVTLRRMINLIDSTCRLFDEEQPNVPLLAFRLGKIKTLAEFVEDESRKEEEQNHG